MPEILKLIMGFVTAEVVLTTAAYVIWIMMGRPAERRSIDEPIRPIKW